MGLSLRNVAVKVIDAGGKAVYSDFGEMMFTHFGVTGPIILSASARIKDMDISALSLSIDLKPALDEKTLDARLLSDFKKNSNRDFRNSLGDLLPSKMIEPFIKLTRIAPDKKVNLITKDERRAILTLLKDFRIPMYNELKKKAVELHQQLPYSKFIGWDLSVNKDNEVELVEINANCPGLFQGATGPAFGDYTEEILEYCKH